MDSWDEWQRAQVWGGGEDRQQGNQRLSSHLGVCIRDRSLKAALLRPRLCPGREGIARWHTETLNRSWALNRIAPTHRRDPGPQSS